MSSSPTVSIVGLNANEIHDVLVSQFPKLRIRSQSEHSPRSNAADVFIVESSGASSGLDEISRLRRENEILQEQASKATRAIQSFHQQQQALFDEFVVLRQKYDDQKASLVSALWQHCARHHPELTDIPSMESDTFIETEKQIGQYGVGGVLGEGQFATVCTCWKGVEKKPDSVEYALKIIKKERITTFNSLRRVSTEIKTLRTLKHSDCVVTVIDVIHTQKHLYIVTEKGGIDLFEFFDEHSEGVPEKWALEIIGSVLRAVLHCHDYKICHRDLKPENILLRFDVSSQKCLDLKLCDFGLSTEFDTKTQLTDFCGSPGFFAPEMIMLGSYFGHKADIWSLGCILLELVLGHEKFCTLWMGAYDYTVMQNREQFTSEIKSSVKQLPHELRFSEALNEALTKFLVLDPVERPNALQMCGLAWFRDRFKAELERDEEEPPPPKDDFEAPRASHAGHGLRIVPNISNRERRFFESHMNSMEINTDVEGSVTDTGAAPEPPEMHLPPIEPATPSIGKARKMLWNKNDAESPKGGKQMGGGSSSGIRSSASAPNVVGASASSGTSPLRPNLGGGGGSERKLGNATSPSPLTKTSIKGSVLEEKEEEKEAESKG
jgi:serine/threonine protein kinase